MGNSTQIMSYKVYKLQQVTQIITPHSFNGETRIVHPFIDIFINFCFFHIIFLKNIDRFLHINCKFRRHSYLVLENTND